MSVTSVVVKLCMSVYISDGQVLYVSDMCGGCVLPQGLRGALTGGPLRRAAALQQGQDQEGLEDSHREVRVGLLMCGCVRNSAMHATVWPWQRSLATHTHTHTLTRAHAQYGRVLQVCGVDPVRQDQAHGPADRRG